MINMLDLRQTEHTKYVECAYEDLKFKWIGGVHDITLLSQVKTDHLRKSCYNVLAVSNIS
jgi:hypothetical protein